MKYNLPPLARSLLFGLVVFMLVLILILPTPISGRPGSQITIPTRTPEPGGGGEPTATPDPGGGGGGGGGGGVPPTPGGPTPGGTVPGPTPVTPPGQVTLAPTPLGGYLPTVQPCDPAARVLSLGNVFVRSGPGIDYGPVGALQYLEVRLIRGRAQNHDWWLIELADGSSGWVANLAVQVQGYTGLVPIVTPPALANGATPTPGPLWNPTPNPVCTVFPTETPTPTATWTPGPSPTASLTPEPTLTHTPLPSPTTGLATIAPQATATVPAAAITIVPTTVSPTPALTSASLTPTSPSAAAAGGSSSNVVLWAGLGLILTAGIVAFASRLRGGAVSG